MDVRYDPIGPINRMINWVFTGRKPRLLRRMVSIVFHVEFPTLKLPIRMPHPYGIVMTDGVCYGQNLTLFQGVTIGSKRHGKRAGQAIIGNDVVIYPNAVIVGAVQIGDGATIGPGAVVIQDVPGGCTVVGNPARIVERSAE